MKKFITLLTLSLFVLLLQNVGAQSGPGPMTGGPGPMTGGPGGDDHPDCPAGTTCDGMPGGPGPMTGGVGGPDHLGRMPGDPGYEPKP